MTQLLLLEDHALVREGLERSLLERIPGASIAYTGASLPDAEAILENTHVDCAIVDLDLGDGRSAVEVVSTFTSRNVPVVVVSALGDMGVVQSAVIAGASAYVTKHSDSAELVTAVNAVLNGENFMSPTFAGALVPTSTSRIVLSEQQQKALVLYASGLKLDTVARRMGVAPSTVKQYIDRVREKYTAAGKVARTKTDLYRIAREAGLLP
jgi:DNA-binding NarL/FixJ family response regulator